MNTVRLGLKNFTTALLAVAVVASMLVIMQPQAANAALTLTINVAPGPAVPRIVANNKIRFNVDWSTLDADGLTGGALDATKVHITSGALSGASAAIITAGNNSDTDGVIEVTFAGTPFSATNTSFSAGGQGLWVEVGAFSDGTNANVGVASGGTDLAIYDFQSPTFTANRTALNSITLTFSETVTSGGFDTNSFTVDGASATDASAVTGGNTITLTTTGLTSTSSTPAVTYVALDGDVLDASVATNEVANGVGASAADGVKPTFTANRTALNSITLTFSETVTSGGFDTNSFTVDGASATDASAVTDKHIFYSSCELRCSNR
ncbi:MAG: hypothetical protein NTX72_06280 [Candidatus Uhrbacteria bacterium]|nr:hypothetical protein [Candidatus Uhrbacteria bacterium]